MRHYLNLVIPSPVDQSEEDDQMDTGASSSLVQEDQRFYKRIAHFNKICYRFFKNDYMKITSQQVGPVDQEDNMREILSQMDLDMLHVIFKEFHLNVPGEDELRQVRQFIEGMNLEDLMIEVLIEENHLKRYEDIRLGDVAVMPTESDLWTKQVHNVLLST